jgi:hypothetical protein
MRARSIVLIVGLALVLGTLATALVAPAVRARSVPCPDGPIVTVTELLALAGHPYDHSGANPRGHACFGSATIRIRAVANWPDGLGGTSMSGITPREFEWPSLYLFESAREVAPGYGAGRFYGVVVPPRFGSVERTFHRRWVDVVARFGDPYANRCRGWAAVGRPMSRAKAVATCRDSLVLVSIGLASGAPDTATAPIAPITPTPALGAAAPVPVVCAGAGAFALAWRRSRRPRARG